MNSSYKQLFANEICTTKKTPPYNRKVEKTHVNFYIKTLAILLTCHIGASTPSLSSPPLLSMDEVNSETHVKHYNKLSTVEEADKNLHSNPKFESVLKKAGEIITHNELESYFGLRLIHRHFPLKNNQIMVEEHQILSGKPSLVTYAHSLEEAKEKQVFLSSWMFSPDSNDIYAFEATIDEAAKTGAMLVQRNPQFLDDMEKLLRENNLNNLLSLAVLKRESLPATKDQIYLEVNSSSEETSVVQLWNDKESPHNSIVTSWSFNGPSQLKCSSKCSATSSGHAYSHTW